MRLLTTCVRPSPQSVVLVSNKNKLYIDYTFDGALELDKPMVTHGGG